MNKRINFLLIIATVVISLSSCKKDEEEKNIALTGKYIINYGSFTGAKSTITAFDENSDSTIQSAFEAVNNFSIVSNIQHANVFNNNIYFMGNNADEVMFVNKNSLEQTKNAITKDIVKPRFSVGEGNYLYVSCWGGDMWIDNSTSYIAKINITTNTVEEKIALPGGPEGLAIVNNKLYAALNYKDSIAVIDINNNDISYIATESTSSYFLKDNNDNLYVSLASYSPGDLTGLGYINTSNNTLVVYPLAGISANYANIMVANSDFSMIYVVASSWVEQNDGTWIQTGSIVPFNASTKTFDQNVFISGNGINGVAIDNNKLFVLVSPSATENGSMKAYNFDGTFIKEYATGIAPFMMLTVD